MKRIVSLILDIVFVAFLGLGAGGAALATAVSQCVSFCILISFFLRGKSIVSIHPKYISRRFADYSKLILTGIPTVFRQGLGSIATMLLNVAARGWGDAAVAAMSIVGRIFMFLMSIILGVGQGFQPVAGFNYGAKKYGRVRSATLFTMGASFAGVCVMITVCWFAAVWKRRWQWRKRSSATGKLP